MRRGPADGLRPASWSGTGPWPARVAGTGALRRNGDLFANSVRTCGPAGCWGSSPGRLYLFSPLPLPSPWSVLFPAPIPGGALEPKVRGRGFFCAGRHGEGQRLQGLRLLAASSGAGPDGPKRFNRYHHIDGRCHLDLFKMLGTLDPDVHRPGARPRGVRRWARTAGGRRATPPRDRVSTRTRPAAGTKCRRVGQRQRRRAPHSRSSSARPNSWRHPARPGRYREPSPDTALAGRQSLFRNRPVAGRRCRTGALGAVAGTADAKACVRGAGGGVLAFSRPADYLYSLLPASPSRGSSVSRADSVRRGRPEVMDGIDAGAPDDRGGRPLPYRTGGSGL